jgi:hypothetical protein
MMTKRHRIRIRNKKILVNKIRKVQYSLIKNIERYRYRIRPDRYRTGMRESRVSDQD